MEALVSELSGSLSVGTEREESGTGPARDTEPDAAADSCSGGDHRQAQYKNAARVGDSQHARRRDLLQRQKRERDDRLDRLRAITGDDDASEEEMDTAALPSAFRYQKKEYYQSQYSHQLMFSEWMEEKPADLDTDWLLKICPTGKRCLVVAKRRSTRAYSASGALLRTFPSQLPCGWRGPLGQRPTVLDCIWSEADSTFYVLDLLAWNGHQVFDCETEFRFSWLQSQLSDSPELGIASRRNPYRFVAIPQSPCTPSALCEAAAGACGADGVLFFHRAAHYRPGGTPLVLWLKPYMLPEVLDVPQTPQELGAPPDYPGWREAIRRWEEGRKQRKPRRQQNREQMMDT